MARHARDPRILNAFFTNFHCTMSKPIAANLRYLRDLHNDYHAGLSCTFHEMICGVPEVDQAGGGCIFDMWLSLPPFC